MLLIVCDSEDFTTLLVISRLKKMNVSLAVITDETKIERICVENYNTILNFSNGMQLNFKDIKAYWYRGGALVFPNKKNENPQIIANHLYKENEKIIELLNHRLSNIPNLSADNSIFNRLIVMDMAKDAGLKVPAFGVFSTKQDVKRFFVKQKKIVTKPISDGLVYTEEEVNYMQYTSLMMEEDVENLTDEFVPGLFATYIEKKYELRIFYLDGICYAMSILSQLDKQTSIDMRKYNYQKPNRSLPYKMPTIIEKKIRVLMNMLSLNTGSIDMIVTPNDEFIFLEVNPIGQFGNVSISCNYMLEQKVADYLYKILA